MKYKRISSKSTYFMIEASAAKKLTSFPLHVPEISIKMTEPGRNLN